MLPRRTLALARSALVTAHRARLSTSVSRHLKAAVVTELGKPLEIRDEKMHTPREGEVVVEVESAGFNAGDRNMIEGRYHLKPPVPFVPGYEVAGNVKAVGKGVSKWKEGDRVLAIKTQGTGAFAEECILTSTDVIFSIPFSVSYEMAASVAVTYSTAYLALQRMAREREGSSVLVLSSRGTMGFAAIDLAQNVFKAHVLAASDTEEKLEALRATGVQQTINWTREDLPRAVRKATFGKGVDVAIDTVGGTPFQLALNSLKVGGSVVSLSFASGEIPSVSLLDLHRLHATVSGVWLGGHSNEEIEAILHIIVGLLDEGYLNARIERKYPLVKINECIEDVKAAKVFGKIIINPKDE